MPRVNIQARNVRRLLAAALVMAALALPAAASAQVVVVANGSPITELDIQQRTKLIATSTHKAPARQDVINELIDDRIKIARAKVYGLEVSDTEVNNAFNGMATRQRISPAQFTQVLERAGISANAVKARIRAELTWGQLVRGKFSASLQVGESDIANVLKDKDEAANAAAYVYTLYPVTIVVPRGSPETQLAGKLREAENLRGRFTNCTEGLALARALRDVAVREPISRSSADLPPQLRELLGNMQVGKLTTPEVTGAGLQMYALCDKKESTGGDTPAKREAREQIFSKRFEAESKKFLEELRKQAMIEYKK